MSQEREGQPTGFSFTEQEQLYDRISHARFLALVQQPDIVVHEVKEDSNSFGEYLFVTLGSPSEPGKLLTFWGLGYHEYRERWITDTWEWYADYLMTKRQNRVPKDDALSQIKEREDDAKAHAAPANQSRRAQLYELVADLTDDDGALTELEDLENLGWMFLGDDDDESGE